MKPGYYRDVEKLMFRVDARTTWSRLCFAPREEYITAYPELYKFIKIKNELDPENLFSNEFSDAILGLE